MERLASNLGKPSLEEAPHLRALTQQPQDGAIVLLYDGSVKYAAVKLGATQARYRLVRTSVTVSGTRHAAALSLAVWLGFQSHTGVVFVRSDSGGVHCILPKPEGEAPRVFYIPTGGGHAMPPTASTVAMPSAADLSVAMPPPADARPVPPVPIWPWHATGASAVTFAPAAPAIAPATATPAVAPMCACRPLDPNLRWHARTVAGASRLAMISTPPVSLGEVCSG